MSAHIERIRRARLAECAEPSEECLQRVGRDLAARLPVPRSVVARPWWSLAAPIALACSLLLYLGLARRQVEQVPVTSASLAEQGARPEAAVRGGLVCYGLMARVWPAFAGQGEWQDASMRSLRDWLPLGGAQVEEPPTPAAMGMSERGLTAEELYARAEEAMAGGQVGQAQRALAELRRRYPHHALVPFTLYDQARLAHQAGQDVLAADYLHQLLATKNNSSLAAAAMRLLCRVEASECVEQP